VLYILYMTSTRSFTAKAAHTLHVRIGRLFEATASGWGVATVPVLLVMLLAAAAGVLGAPG
jgi:hypothetical protein